MAWLEGVGKMDNCKAPRLGTSSAKYCGGSIPSSATRADQSNTV